MNDKTKFLIMVIVCGSLGAASAKLYDKLTTWLPPEGTNPMVFLRMDEKLRKQTPIVQINGTGILCVDLPESYKAWQQDLKTKTEEKKKEK